MKEDFGILGWTLGITTLIFIADLFVPLGVAMGVFYVLSIAVLIRSKSVKPVFLIAILAVLFTSMAYFIQLNENTPTAAGVNRIISIIAIIAMAAVVIFNKVEVNKVLFNLKSTNRLFKDAQRVAQIGVWKVNLQNKTPKWTSETFEIFGFNNKEKFKDQNLINYIHNDYRDIVLEHIKAAKKLGEKWDIEVKVVTRDKEEKWVRLVGYPVFVNGEVVEIRGLLMDINTTKTNELNLKQKHQEILTYQAKLLNSQINPHFMFNALNAIQYYILDQDTEAAINQISNFSQLMRTVLNNSSKEFISINEEVEWLTKYMSLERIRFSEKFDFIVDIDEAIDADEEMIPTMLIQPFIENAILHGVGPLHGKGEIKLSFMKNGDKISCIIEDNGIGRKKAAELKKLRDGGEHSSKGMQITSAKIELLDELFKGQFEYEIIDKCDEKGNAQGTKVKISYNNSEML